MEVYILRGIFDLMDQSDAFRESCKQYSLPFLIVDTDLGISLHRCTTLITYIYHKVQYVKCLANQRILFNTYASQ